MFTILILCYLACQMNSHHISIVTCMQTHLYQLETICFKWHYVTVQYLHFCHLLSTFIKHACSLHCALSRKTGDLIKHQRKDQKPTNMEISYSHDRACEGYRFTNRELPMPIGGFNLFQVVESSYAHHWAFAAKKIIVFILMTCQSHTCIVLYVPYCISTSYQSILKLT